MAGMKRPNDHTEPTKVDTKKSIKKYKKRNPKYQNLYISPAHLHFGEYMIIIALTRNVKNMLL